MYQVQPAIYYLQLAEARPLSLDEQDVLELYIWTSVASFIFLLFRPVPNQIPSECSAALEWKDVMTRVLSRKGPNDALFALPRDQKRKVTDGTGYEKQLWRSQGGFVCECIADSLEASRKDPPLRLDLCTPLQCPCIDFDIKNSI